MAANFERFSVEFDAFIKKFIHKIPDPENPDKLLTQIQIAEDTAQRFAGYYKEWPEIKKAYIREHPFMLPAQRWKVMTIDLDMVNAKQVLEAAKQLAEAILERNANL